MRGVEAADRASMCWNCYTCLVGGIAANLNGEWHKRGWTNICRDLSATGGYAVLITCSRKDAVVPLIHWLLGHIDDQIHFQ
jgi:hypothetical protein